MVLLSVKSTYFFTPPMTIEIWYVPFFNLAAIVYVLGEVKSVNLESWTDRAVVFTPVFISLRIALDPLAPQPCKSHVRGVK